MTQTLAHHFRAMSRNNAWANGRLLRACAGLQPGEFRARGTSFFPSISLTLNHNLLVDWYYVDALEGGGKGQSIFAAHEASNDEPYPELAPLARAQAEVDHRLIAYCDALNQARLESIVRLDRGARGMLEDKASDVLAHLFEHQIHHRGQAHAMLAGTSVRPPQLDEFFLSEDWKRRDAELQQMGLN